MPMGEGVPRDDAEAARWYLKAAEQGDADAQFNLGVMHANGEGVPKNDAEAVRRYRKAAKQGLAKAQSSLGAAYALGKGVPNDSVMAYMWFNLAGTQGKENVRELREAIANEMTTGQIAEAQRRSRICLESNYQDC